MSKTLTDTLDDMQKGMDFTFIEAQATGRPLTKEQLATKERMEKNAENLNDRETNAEITRILNS